jgi:predicted RNA binding protein YcfA (HicA-like mRNA interferase family)
MKSISGRDFARLIERRGWRLLRISGSHHIYSRATASCVCQFPSTAIAR